MAGYGSSLTGSIQRQNPPSCCCHYGAGSWRGRWRGWIALHLRAAVMSSRCYLIPEIPCINSPVTGSKISRQVMLGNNLQYYCCSRRGTGPWAGENDRAYGQGAGSLRAHPSWWSRRTGSRDRGKTHRTRCTVVRLIYEAHAWAPSTEFFTRYGRRIVMSFARRARNITLQYHLAK